MELIIHNFMSKIILVFANHDLEIFECLAGLYRDKPTCLETILSDEFLRQQVACVVKVHLLSKVCYGLRYLRDFSLGQWLFGHSLSLHLFI